MSGAPLEIYQAWLDRIDRCFWQGRDEEVAAAMHYPHSMATQDAVVHFDRPEKMIEAARHFREALRSAGAQNYARLCVEAAFATPDRIEGRHQTFILSGGRYVVEPFMNSMTLVRRDGAWFGAGVTYDVRNTELPVLSARQLIDERRTLQ